jgi:hypothetical protein
MLVSSHPFVRHSVFLVGCGLLTASMAWGADPPRRLMAPAIVKDSQEAGGGRVGFSILRLPHQNFAFYDRDHPSSSPLELSDTTGRLYRLSPPLPSSVLSQSILDSGVLNNTQVIMTSAGKLISVFVKAEAIAPAQVAVVGLPRYLNVWMREAFEGRVSEPRLVWRGYNGSQMEYEQLPSGRLLVPFGSFQPHARAVPPQGRHLVVIQYSDDQGQSWTESPSKLSSPCYEGFNGSNEGACEPAIERLDDGRLWMLFRTQAGFLYESFSSDEGTTWLPATASRFSTSTGPPNILRSRDGALIVCWNNAELPPRVNGDGVYGGRDALHMAISRDDGRTWRGFREIYLDHRRNDNPASSGDRGTAYPLAATTEDGYIVVLAGQGEGGRLPILVDPAWIEATEARSDFHRGLNDWSVYKHHGPAQRWWRARAVGCQLVHDPDDADRKCLQLRKADELPSDGAVWNFPNGWSGSLKTRIWLAEGCQPASLSLNDRMFDPSNDEGERLAVYRVEFTPQQSLSLDLQGRVAKLGLEKNCWHTLHLAWDCAQGSADLSIDGKRIGTVPWQHPTINGVSYLRWRSLAETLDPSGFLIDDPYVHIEEAAAPPVTPQQLLEYEQRYREQVVSHWRMEQAVSN